MKGTWLAPGVIVAGVAVAAAGIWYWHTAQPVIGAEIDRVDCGGATAIVHAEANSDRSFLELDDPNGKVVWAALIPHYAGAKGRPALACGASTVTVRVERSGRAEVFGFFLHEGDKIGAFRLAPEHEPIATQPGPITMTDHLRSYEFVGGLDWHQVIAVDLATGKGEWKTDLGPEAVESAVFANGGLAIRQSHHDRLLELATGRDVPVTVPVN